MSNPGDWQIDGEEFLLNPTLIDEKPLVEAIPEPKATPPAAENHNPIEEESPSTPQQIIEAMLFVGGPPLTIDQIRQAIRGVSSDQILAEIQAISHRYTRQQRPYSIQSRETGFQLVVKPSFRSLREKLHGGPREARLSQPALDILSLVAYRQPIGKGEIEAIRGSDCQSPIRQLVRLGLIAQARRGEAEGQVFTTTHRFLELFQLPSLDDLPRLGETQLMG